MRQLERLRAAAPALTTEIDRHVDIYYPAYQDGFLLAGGGLADQPARYLELIGRIRSTDRAVEFKYLQLTTKDQE